MGNTMGQVSTKWAKDKCFDLIEDGDVRKLEKMLMKRPQFCKARNGPRSDGMSLLILASFLDKPDKVNLLLSKGANPDQPCGYGVTALHLACLHGHSKIVRSLLNGGADPATSDFFGQNSLHYAAACSKLNGCGIVQQLIRTGLDLNLRDHHMRTALHMACLVHHLDIAKLLLSSGINLHIKDLIGREALSYIINDKIRNDLSESVTFREAVRLHEIKAFLVVLHHKTFHYNPRHLELKSVLKEDKFIDYRKVFNVEELRLRICSYL